MCDRLVKTLLAYHVTLRVFNNSRETKQCLLIENPEENNVGEISSRIVSRGQSIRSYCLRHGISEGTFHYWRKKLPPSIRTKTKPVHCSNRCARAFAEISKFLHHFTFFVGSSGIHRRRNQNLNIN